MKIDRIRFATRTCLFVAAAWLVVGCATSQSARADDGTEKADDSDLVREVQLVNHRPEEGEPLEEVSCARNVGSMGGKKRFRAVTNCRDKLRRDARDAGGDVVVLTTQEIECSGGGCSIFMYGTAYSTE